MLTKSIEQFHLSGKKYLIIDIPIMNEKLYLLNYYVQMMINDLEKRTIKQEQYSFSEFVITKLGIEVYNHLTFSSAASTHKDRVG